MSRRLYKIKSCKVINPPATAKDQEEYDRRFARALATALYRTLSEKEFDLLIEGLRERKVS